MPSLCTESSMNTGEAPQLGKVSVADGMIAGEGVKGKRKGWAKAEEQRRDWGSWVSRRNCGSARDFVAQPPRD